MASSVQSVPSKIKPGVAPLRAGVGTSFLLRRLHSLSGVIPIGLFLLEHFISNAEAFKGPAAYTRQVEFLNGLPFVIVLELFGIWLPILYHGLYGVYIWYRGESNTIDYPWTGNWLYAAQRWTGIVSLIYIAQHTYHLRFTGVHLPTHPAAAFAKVQGEFQNPWMIAFYGHHGIFLTVCGYSQRSGALPQARLPAAASGTSASCWRLDWWRSG